jgi:sugar phosphate isomerase/epimerase
MKLGIATALTHNSPGEWAGRHARLGLEAVVFPLDHTADMKLIDGYAEAAREHALVIAEVGAWCNPICADKAQRRNNIGFCIRQLELADYIGALCCVNIAGAAGEVWDGGYPENYLPETYEAIVSSVREIIDTAKPKRTRYALETMPWMYPDSPESYLRLMGDIDRPGFGVHMDMVNMINCPSRYFNSADFTNHCFALLGDKILSCHLKDVILRNKMTLTLDETFPGTGGFDIKNYIEQADRINSGTPFIIEHLGSEEEYIRAVGYVRGLTDVMHTGDAKV